MSFLTTLEEGNGYNCIRGQSYLFSLAVSKHDLKLRRASERARERERGRRKNERSMKAKMELTPVIQEVTGALNNPEREASVPVTHLFGIIVAEGPTSCELAQHIFQFLRGICEREDGKGMRKGEKGVLSRHGSLMVKRDDVRSS